MAALVSLDPSGRSLLKAVSLEKDGMLDSHQHGREASQDRIMSGEHFPIP